MLLATLLLFTCFIAAVLLKETLFTYVSLLNKGFVLYLSVNGFVFGHRTLEMIDVATTPSA